MKFCPPCLCGSPVYGARTNPFAWGALYIGGNTMNALRHFGIEDGRTVLAGEDDKDCRAQIEMARVNLWQAADCLNRVNQWSDNCSFEQEIDTIGKLYHSLQGSYDACEGRPPEDLAEVIAPAIEAWIKKEPGQSLESSFSVCGVAEVRREAELSQEESAGAAADSADEQALCDVRDALGMVRALAPLLELAQSSASDLVLFNGAMEKRDVLESEMKMVINALGGAA